MPARHTELYDILEIPSDADEDAIKKADELGICMLFTGVRHFKH